MALRLRHWRDFVHELDRGHEVRKLDALEKFLVTAGVLHRPPGELRQERLHLLGAERWLPSFTGDAMPVSEARA
jgi:hypothetical protein